MIFGILHNTALNRYHPICFRPAPPPSGDDDLAFQRYKSKGHHTDGFPTLEAAQEYVTSMCKEGDHHDASLLWVWDGDCIPAMTQWFSRPKIAA